MTTEHVYRLRIKAFLFEALMFPLFVLAGALGLIVFSGFFDRFLLGFADYMTYELGVLPLITAAILIYCALLALYQTLKGASPGHKIMGLALDTSLSFTWRFARYVLIFVPALFALVVVGMFVSDALFPVGWDEWVFLGGAVLGVLNLLPLVMRHEPLHNGLFGVKVIVRDVPAHRYFYTLGGVLLLFNLGGLFMIVLPNFLMSQDGSCGDNLGSTKSNMHTFQTIVETYGVDWGGVYADNVSLLQQEAQAGQNPYWKDFKNPISGYNGLGKSFADETGSPEPGIVTYRVEKDIYGQHTSYAIYGYDKDGKPLKYKGSPFFLSNS